MEGAAAPWGAGAGARQRPDGTVRQPSLADVQPQRGEVANHGRPTRTVNHTKVETAVGDGEKGAACPRGAARKEGCVSSGNPPHGPAAHGVRRPPPTRKSTHTAVRTPGAPRRVGPARVGPPRQGTVRGAPEAVGLGWHAAPPQGPPGDAARGPTPALPTPGSLQNNTPHGGLWPRRRGVTHMRWEGDNGTHLKSPSNPHPSYIST